MAILGVILIFTVFFIVPFILIAGLLPAAWFASASAPISEIKFKQDSSLMGTIWAVVVVLIFALSFCLSRMPSEKLSKLEKTFQKYLRDFLSILEYVWFVIAKLLVKIFYKNFR